MTTVLALLVSAFSVAVGVYSLAFSIYAWAQANRPLVTARITTHHGGNVGITLNLFIENSGNRPAHHVQMAAKVEDVRAAMRNPRDPIPSDVERAFFSDVFVPVLANGRHTTGGFGSLGPHGIWRAGALLPATLRYRAQGGRQFNEACTLLLADDAGFAQVFWEKAADSR